MTFFKNDRINGRDTLACNLARKNVPVLQGVQMDVVSRLTGLRKPGLITRYQGVYDSLGSKERENLDTFGYPFVGQIWEPHLSIASFEKDAFSIILEKFKDTCPVGHYHVNSLNFYELDESSEKLELVKKYPLTAVQQIQTPGGTSGR